MNDSYDYNCPFCHTLARTTTIVKRAGKLGICNQCGLWFRVHRPTPQELKAIYGKHYYDAWDMQRHPQSVELSKKKTFSRILKKIDACWVTNSSPKTLLDVGAATGHFVDMAQTMGWSVYALETNPFSLDVLRKKIGHDHVFCDPITNVNIEEGSLDMITMLDVIEHVLDLETLLCKSSRLLKENGILCITTPRIDSCSRLFMRKNWLHYKEEHVQYFTKQSLKTILQNYGFEVKKAVGHTKWLHFSYLYAQFMTFPHWFFSPILECLDKILPTKIKRLPLPYRCGEMLVVAQKSSKRL